MKIFSFIISAVMLLAALVFIIIDFPDLSTTNGIIYFFILLILILICITGLIINVPFTTRVHRKFKGATKYNHV